MQYLRICRAKGEENRHSVLRGLWQDVPYVISVAKLCNEYYAQLSSFFFFSISVNSDAVIIVWVRDKSLF